jgi:hypothetical protein
VTAHKRYDQEVNNSPRSDAKVESDLRQAFFVATPPSVRRNIGATLHAEASRASQSRLSLAPRFHLTAPRRMALYLSAAVALAIVSVTGAIGLSRPASVSAAQLLRRASAAMTPQAGQVVHETSVYHLDSTHKFGQGFACGVRSGGSVVCWAAPSNDSQITTEQWTQVDGNGNTTQFSITDTGNQSGLISGVVGNADGTMWFFTNPPTGTQVTETSWSPGTPGLWTAVGTSVWPGQLTNRPQDPTAMENLLQKATAGSASLTLLPQQQIDGQTVDAVQETTSGLSQSAEEAFGGLGLIIGRSQVSEEQVTFYIDPTTYLVKALELDSLDSQGNTVEHETVDIGTYEIVSPGEVPPGIFTYTPPAGAKVTTLTRCAERSWSTESNPKPGCPSTSQAKTK